MDAFLSQYDDSVDQYLGSGDFGDAYYTKNGKVLKSTTSKKELEIANTLLGKHNNHIADIYAVGAGMIYMEYLEEDSNIENEMYKVGDALESQGLWYNYISHFDEEQYEEEFGYPLDDDVRRFMSELEDVVWEASHAGFIADIKDDNLGRKPNGKLGLLDVGPKEM